MNLRFYVDLAEVGDLVPHEEVELLRLLFVKNSIESAGRMFKPVVVDLRSGTVIDGHHRLAALRALGFKYVPAVFVDYWRDVERIGGWIYVSHTSTDRVVEVVRVVLELLSSVKKGYSTIRIRAGGLSAEFSVDAVDYYLAVKEFKTDGLLLKYFVKAAHQSCAHVQGIACIEQPGLSVYEVLKIAQRGLMMPPRTTLHVTEAKKVWRTFRVKELR